MERGSEFRSRVAAALDGLRPALRLDGQEAELVDVVGSDALIRFTGACEG